MGNAIFADRIVNIAVTGALVRIEFGVVEPPRAKGQKPQLVPSQTLVLPIDGFAASMDALDALMKQLLRDGVIKPRPQAGDVIENSAKS